MKVINVKKFKSEESVSTIDLFVKGGYVQGASGSLP